ncbi:hypothetical protein [Persephonella sp.]|nr:hypothetical protein [Aquificota bacterium]
MEIIFESRRFEILENDARDVFFTERVGNFLLAELQKFGFRPRFHKDDWGVRLVIEEENVKLYIRITAEWKDDSLPGESLIAFKCVTGYSITGKGKFLSLLGKLSPEEKLSRLNWTLKNILSPGDIKILSIKNDIVSM